MSVFKLKSGSWSDLSSTSESLFGFFFFDFNFDSFLAFFFSNLSFLSFFFFNFLDLVFFGFLRLVSSVAMLSLASLHLLGGGEGDLLVDREGPGEDGEMSLVWPDVGSHLTAMSRLGDDAVVDGDLDLTSRAFLCGDGDTFPKTGRADSFRSSRWCKISIGSDNSWQHRPVNCLVIK